MIDSGRFFRTILIMGSPGSTQALSGSFSSLYRDYLLPMTPGPMIRELIEASFDPEVQAPRITEIIESNPLYSHYLQKLDILREKVQEWREEVPEDLETERLTRFIVVLLGPSAVRNAVLSTWINRHAGQGLPRKDGVPFMIIPRTQLRYALALSDYSDENHLAHADLAYMSGLCFDWVSTLLEKKGGPAKSEKKYLEELFGEAVKAARIAYEIAAIPEKLILSRCAFSATLLTYLGKVLMAASYPKRDDDGLGWKDFVKLCESHGSRSQLAYQILERRKFNWTHAEAAALCAMLFEQLKPAEAAIRNYLDPVVLRNSDPDSHKLAVLISVSVSLAKSGIAGLSAFQKTELARMGISQELMAAVLSKMGNKKQGK